MANANLSFVFKGGTALSLLLGEITRFSTDIDIIASVGFEASLIAAVEKKAFPQFHTCEKDLSRPETGIRKSHYKFYYHSIYTGKNANVLLDIVYEKMPFSNLLPFQVSNSLLHTSEPYAFVKIPCIDELLADKMTAFAPETIGILYTKNRHTEIIKQLVDIAKLSERSHQIDLVASTYSTISEIEIEHRNGDGLFTPQICLEDSIQTCALLVFSDATETDEHFRFLLSGIDGFGAFVTKTFSLIDAQVCAMKAYCSYIKVKCGSEAKYKKILSNYPNKPVPSPMSKRTKQKLQLMEPQWFDLFCHCYEMNRQMDAHD